MQLCKVIHYYVYVHVSICGVSASQNSIIADSYKEREWKSIRELWNNKQKYCERIIADGADLEQANCFENFIMFSWKQDQRWLLSAIVAILA